jgi:hypothetical protein
MLSLPRFYTLNGSNTPAAETIAAETIKSANPSAHLAKLWILNDCAVAAELCKQSTRPPQRERAALEAVSKQGSLLLLTLLQGLQDLLVVVRLLQALDLHPQRWKRVQQREIKQEGRG